MQAEDLHQLLLNLQYAAEAASAELRKNFKQDEDLYATSLGRGEFIKKLDKLAYCMHELKTAKTLLSKQHDDSHDPLGLYVRESEE